MSENERDRYEFVIFANEGGPEAAGVTRARRSGSRRLNFYAMSYTTCWRRGRLLVVLVGVAALAGCSTPDGAPAADQLVITVSVAATSTDGPDLLGPVEFAAAIAEAGVVVVNVHVPYEGHIAGTDAFVPFDSIESWADLPEDRTTPIAVYCRSGTMSAIAAESLVGLGYSNVVDLAGGMNAWGAVGRQLERS